MTNFDKLKALIKKVEAFQKELELDEEFLSNTININAIEKHCGIKQSSLFRALKRGQESIPFDDKLGKIFEQKKEE